MYYTKCFWGQSYKTVLDDPERCVLSRRPELQNVLQAVAEFYPSYVL